MNDGFWSKNNKDERAAVADRIFKLSRTPFEELRLASRHGLGYEIIDSSDLNFSIPQGLNDRPIAFRYGQSKKAMVGIRMDSTFYVLCIEHDFGDAYNHGGS